jgi:hypothetical protein
MSMTNSVREFLATTCGALVLLMVRICTEFHCSVGPMDEFPTTEKREFVLCYPPNRAPIATALVRLAPDQFYSNPINVGLFSDGEPNVVIPHLHRFTRRHVCYIADWVQPASSLSNPPFCC